MFDLGGNEADADCVYVIVLDGWMGANVVAIVGGQFGGLIRSTVK